MLSFSINLIWVLESKSCLIKVFTVGSSSYKVVIYYWSSSYYTFNFNSFSLVFVFYRADFFSMDDGLLSNYWWLPSYFIFSRFCFLGLFKVLVTGCKSSFNYYLPPTDNFFRFNIYLLLSLFWVLISLWEMFSFYYRGVTPGVWLILDSGLGLFFPKILSEASFNSGVSYFSIIN